MTDVPEPADDVEPGPAERQAPPSARRLDLELVYRRLARSRTAARAAIEAGRVTVDGRAIVKPAHPVPEAAVIAVDGDDRYVSRAALKLVAALDASGIDVRGMLALDLGASTGGFTQVLLERGARQVIALDVGHGQLAPELRADPRVVVVEGENARALTAERLAAVSGVAERPDIVVGDLSFISLTLVLPAVVATVGTGVPVVLLIKPQFEAGRLGIREGIVRDAAVRDDAIMAVLWAASDAGLNASHLLSSPIVGTGGNHEYLVVFGAGVGVHPTEWRARAAELALAHVPDRTVPDRTVVDHPQKGSS
ncbi:TlyA family RNA methyltransferase [Microcella sp.]|uniref:TlyA family RNA methyltransferase n=1 Tax=Microcella sp. TaxID=1913979 RepID=UPI003919C96A